MKPGQLDLKLRLHSLLIDWWKADRTFSRPYSVHESPYANHWIWFWEGAELRRATMLEF